MLIVFLRPIFDFEPRSIVAYDIWVIQDGKNLDLPQETLQALLESGIVLSFSPNTHFLEGVFTSIKIVPATKDTSEASFTKSLHFLKL
jgi:hypothetical protein